MLNINSRFAIRGCAASVAMYALLSLTLQAHAAPFVATNLVTDDQTAHAAQITDDQLVNAWGISFGPSTPFWVSSNEKGLAKVYSVIPTSNSTTKTPIAVPIPGDGNVTGQVFNTAA